MLHEMISITRYYFYLDDNVYYSLNNVAVDEGNSLSDHSGKSLDQCKDLCNLNENCNSFTFGQEERTCKLKDKCVLLPEPTKDNRNGYQTYYKRCKGKITITL